MSNPEDDIKNTENSEVSDTPASLADQEQSEAVEAESDSALIAGSISESIAEPIEAFEEPAEINDPDPQADLDGSDDYQRFSQVLKNAQEISGRLEVLLPGVLDTADATNSAADVSRRASSALENGLDHLQKRVNELVAASTKGAMVSTRILLGAVASLLVAVGLIGFMSVELSARVNQVDSMMVALSKRVVKMNSALASFEQLNFSINQLATRQAQFASNQMLLAEAVTRAEKSTADLNQMVPEATAKSVSAETDKVMAQVNKLSAALIAQGNQVQVVSGSVKKLATQITSFDGRMRNITKLNADVEALITLERENYLELLQRQVDLQALQVAGQQPEEKVAPSIVVYPFVSTAR